jgi:hypothetical protein
MFFSPFPPFSSALTYPFSLGGKCPTPQVPVITPSYSWLAELELKTTDTAEAAVEIRSIYSIQHTLPMAWESNQLAIGNNRIHTSSGYRVHLSCYDHRIDLLSKQCNQHRASVPRPEGVDRLPTLLRHRANPWERPSVVAADPIPVPTKIVMRMRHQRRHRGHQTEKVPLKLEKCTIIFGVGVWVDIADVGG